MQGLETFSKIGSRNSFARRVGFGAVLLLSSLAMLLGTGRVEALTPALYVPTLNSDETVVAMATPQQFGAHGDGVTDDTAAFQAAINAIQNVGHRAGGVLWVPAGRYFFAGNLTLPEGVTIHGDWTDWTGTGGAGATGATGTIFMVTAGAGTGNARPSPGLDTATPFITMAGNDAIVGVTFWYPNQNPAAFAPYPYTIRVRGNSTVQNVIFVNSYNGIEVGPDGPEHNISTVIGCPLSVGLMIDGPADQSLTADIRFNPVVWSRSQLTGAYPCPVTNGPYATTIRNNATGVLMYRTDGELNVQTNVTGYHVGLQADLDSTTLYNGSTNYQGSPNASFYSGQILNCGTAVLAQAMPRQSGLQLTNMTLDGDIAVDTTTTALPALSLSFTNCTITGHSGTAFHFNGARSTLSWAQFSGCIVNGMIQHDGGALTMTNCTLNAATQITMAATTNASVLRTCLEGCTFSPSQHIVNPTPANLLMHAAKPSQGRVPTIGWPAVMSLYADCQPMASALYVATDPAYGAIGDGVHDDTAAIQSALNAAGHGGGIVYLPGNHYKTTGSLTVPPGVELRGVYETRHAAGPWSADGKCKASVIQPTSTAGPAVILQAEAGIRGVDFNYETQTKTSTPIAFPPAVQGQGADVYVIAVTSPNPYFFVDLATYGCANHFIYNVNGFPLDTGIAVGKGSNGYIVNTEGSPSYWFYAGDMITKPVSSADLTAVRLHPTYNLEMYRMGRCVENMMNDYVIPSRVMLHCINEGTAGPYIQAEALMCDATVEAVRLDSAAATKMDIANGSFAIVADYPDLFPSAVAINATANFLGTARFYNTAIFGAVHTNFSIAGGDVGMELVHNLEFGGQGAQISGGTFHLINNNGLLTYDTTGDTYNSAYLSQQYYPFIFTTPGAASLTSEFIGCGTIRGYDYSVTGLGAVNAWDNFSLSTYTSF